MSFLEKVYTLLAKEGRQIKYGTYTTDSADPLVTLEVGESLPNFSHMGDQPAVEYQFLIVGVYSSDYLAGFNLLETIKSELKAAQKTTVRLYHVGNLASGYDKDTTKYIFKSKYKIII